MSALRGLIQNVCWMPESETSLRAELRAHWDAAGKEARARAITSVAVPGALTIDFSDPSNRDAQLLGMTLAYSAASGLAIHPDITIDAFGFKDGRDFLRETSPADMVFVPRILLADIPEKFVHDVTAHSQPCIDVRDPFANAVSPLNIPIHWQKRCIEAGAKLIVSFGGTQDVSSDTFAANAAFETLVPTPEIGFDICTAAMPARILYGQRIDLPYSWMGMTADTAWLAYMRQMPNPARTTLAKIVKKEIAASDLRPITWAAQLGSIFPSLRAVFKLQGHHVSLDGLQREHANTQRHPGPQNRVHP